MLEQGACGPGLEAEGTPGWVEPRGAGCSGRGVACRGGTEDRECRAWVRAAWGPWPCL